MKRTISFLIVLGLYSVLGYAKDEEIEFYGYVDSDICSRVYLGPINESRVECTKSNFKAGDSLVLLRFRDNQVFEPHKQKNVKQRAGEAVKASGKANLDRGRIKVDSLEVVAPDSIPKIELSMWQDRANAGSKVWEDVRHTLAMMPYISDFDFISFAMVGSDVILTGWTIRDTNRSEAYRRVKRVEGVENVTNNIMVLPPGSFDMDIRSRARLALRRAMPQYFWASGSAVKIVVKNGQVILLGSVNREADSEMAFIRCNSVPGVFKVFNLLRVQPSEGAKES